MAYDPEARETSNNAMIISVVALVLVVLGALAYYATRQPAETPVVVTPTTRVIEKTTEAPAPPASTTIINPPANAPAPATSTRTDVTVNTPPAANPAPRGAAPAGDSSSTTIVNNAPPAAATPPATPPAGDGASNSTGTATPAPGY